MQESEFLKAAEASHLAFSNHTGVEYLQLVVADGLNYPFGKLLNINVIAAGDGTATLTAKLSYQFYNPMLRIHGGYLATLMDSSLGCAVLTKLPQGSGAGTVNLNVSYVRKVDVESGLLTARAKVQHSGRSMLTASAEITDSHGKLCVHGTGTFLIYPK